MKKYRHLFFDLDGTLWDLRKNTREALVQLFSQYPTELREIDFEVFFRRYHHHNDHVWALYRDGKIEKEVLRYIRFERAFADVGATSDHAFHIEFANQFMEICPRLPHTLPGTHELLEYCKTRFELHIITNGFIEVQGHKMQAAKLTPYFQKMINSESAGVRKPHPGIFEYAMAQTGATKEESLMIGDDWDADILGARDFGMDQVFLTSTDEMMNEINATHGQKPLRHNYKPTHTIQSLEELILILS